MNVATFLQDHDVQFTVIEHADTYEAARMAQALHVSGREVAKTVLLKADDSYVVAILPANDSIDLNKAAKALKVTDVELVTEDEISKHCPDCEFGVLPPFGSQYSMKTMVDNRLAKRDEICFEGNSHHEAIRMKFEDFQRLEKPLMTDFAWQ